MTPVCLVNDNQVPGNWVRRSLVLQIQGDLAHQIMRDNRMRLNDSVSKTSCGKEMDVRVEELLFQ